MSFLLPLQSKWHRILIANNTLTTGLIFTDLISVIDCFVIVDIQSEWQWNIKYIYNLIKYYS